MYIAQKLKKENVIEYLLYMWQIEDILRAFNFDMEAVTREIITPQKLSVENEKLLCGWYDSLIEMMISEGIKERGHLQINKNTLDELTELHRKELSGKDASYTAKYYHVLPYIAQLRQRQNDSQESDIEVSLNFLYGILLLRLQKKEISKETMNAKDEITKFMILLAHKYNQYKRGELEEE